MPVKPGKHMNNNDKCNDMRVRIAGLKQVRSRLSQNVTRINSTTPVKPVTVKLHDIYVEHIMVRI